MQSGSQVVRSVQARYRDVQARGDYLPRESYTSSWFMLPVRAGLMGDCATPDTAFHSRALPPALLRSTHRQVWIWHLQQQAGDPCQLQVHTVRHNAGGAPPVAGRIIAGVLKADLKRDFKAGEHERDAYAPGWFWYQAEELVLWRCPAPPMSRNTTQIAPLT